MRTRLETFGGGVFDFDGTAEETRDTIRAAECSEPDKRIVSVQAREGRIFLDPRAVASLFDWDDENFPSAEPM